MDILCSVTIMVSEGNHFFICSIRSCLSMLQSGAKESVQLSCVQR